MKLDYGLFMVIMSQSCDNVSEILRIVVLGVT